MRLLQLRGGRRALTERDWDVLDRLLVGVYLVAGQIELALVSDRNGPYWLNVLLLVGLAAVLLLRRSRPLVTLFSVIAIATLGTAVALGPPDLFMQTVALIVASYSVGAHTDLRQGLIGMSVGTIGVVAVILIDDPSDFFFPIVVFLLSPWLVGRVMRNQLFLARELAEKAEQAEHLREAEEQRAVTAERRRIARELHDVLAHNLSVMVVQASGAGRLVDRDPERASEVAALIERTGREAMTELRQMFGAVRRDEGEPLDGPPSIARVEGLAQRARDAGLPVEVVVEGSPEPLPPGVDLAAYRVVQEALSNSYKHAGPAHARVRIAYEPDELVLEVTDDGVGAGDLGSDLGGGHGLVGMRERVALYGGELESGRPRGGGFAVRARIPLAPRAVAR
jgi:signal transduction histidine kinase